MAEQELSAGYGTGAANKSVVTQGVLHLFLLAAASAFMVPFVWMAVTALKPRDQTMSIPPAWIPRATMATIEGQRTVVIKIKTLPEDSVIVIQRGGHEVGRKKILPALTADGKPSIVDGKAITKYSHAGREELEKEPVPVEVVKHCPAGYWNVEEWTPEFSEERERNNTELKWDCVPESDLSSVPHLFWSNYQSVLNRMRETGSDKPWYAEGFFRFLFNTLWVCVLSVIGLVVSCTLVAYAFAFLDFPGKDLLFAVTLCVMMIPFPATMVTLFDVFKSLGWIGSFKPLWVPAWFGQAFSIFLLRQFFLGLPKDLLDAARIDGCTELEILWHVVVPLARPALAMVALFQFIGSWKDFMGPMLYLTDKSQFTLSVALQAFQSQHGGTPFHILMAAGMMFAMPLVVLFLMARKSFMRGIAMTGLKG